MQVVPVATLKDIVANARAQRADATLADLFDALTYYYDHDAFLSLPGESGLSRGSAPIRSVQTRREPPGALDDHTHSSITTLAAAGDAFARSGQIDLALEKYRQALAQLPDPLEEWEAATWLLGAIGDSLFHKGDHAQAREVLQQAMRCPGAIGNPFRHLRLGQTQLELGDLERAKDELARAYMGAGDAIFRDENPRYRLFLKEALRPSEGGSPS
jgi:tetratricopeptide (TPR) repeat protein